MSNVGKVIKDFYCGGFFGREYDLSGAEIVAESDEWIVIKKENGLFEFGDFQYWDWNRNEDGTLAAGISNLRTMSSEERQKLIDEWCY